MAAQLTRKLKEQGLATLAHLNPGSLPDFVIVGAQKAGTSSLFAALTSHHAISSSLRKEVHYFDLRTDTHPLSWYKGHFLPAFARPGGSIVGEASPSYMFFPDCADAIARACPDARILIVLRDPVSRAISHYHHNRRHLPHLESQTDPEAAIFAETERAGPILADLVNATHADRARAARFAYLTRGHYAEQIERFHTALGRDRVMVIDTQDLANAPENGLSARLTGFLGVADQELVFERRNKGTGTRKADAALERRLAEYYAPHDAKLQALLERPLSWHEGAAL